MKSSNIPPNVSEQEYIQALRTIPKELISTNGKLKKDSIGVFSIPALFGTIVENGSLKDISTCPGAGSCARFCYAQKGNYSFKNTKLNQNRKLQFILDAMKDKKKLEIFSAIIYSDILRNGFKIVRIHDSGDYFNLNYYNFLVKNLIHKFPDVQFYSYTKQIPMFLYLESKKRIPENLKIIYSTGSKHDDFIPKDSAHTRIFKTKKDLYDAGYVDCSESDYPASIPSNKKIGLIFH